MLQSAGPPAAQPNLECEPLLLVVDDDPSCSLVDVLAEKMGFRVKAVSSGLQALEHLRDGLQPHVILLDIMMERIDGLTFMNHLREMPSVEPTPVVAMSTAAVLDRYGEQLQVNGTLLKPITQPRSRRRSSASDDSTRFVALFVALVAGVGVAVWYYRAPGRQPSPRRIVRNDDRWLDDLQSRSPKDVEQATAQLEQRGTAALPLIRRTLQDPAAHPRAAARRRSRPPPSSARAPPRRSPTSPRRCSDPDYAPEAALALSFMGSAAVPPLREAIQSDESGRAPRGPARARQAARARVHRSADRHPGAARVARRSGSRRCATSP